MAHATVRASTATRSSPAGRFAGAECFSIEISKDKFHRSEKRLGHKKALWAELEMPLGLLPVVSVHLDAYASAAQRGAQLADVLDKVAQRGLGERVLLGGDLNTNTYDAKHPGQICLNVARKAARGGFPHAIHHYLHPYALYERPVFDLIEARGLDYRSFNDLTAGTTRYEVGTHESESTISEQLPGFAVKILRHKLRPWNGVADLKVDWFFGCGLQVRHGLGGTGPGGGAAAQPRTDGAPEGGRSQALGSRSDRRRRQLLAAQQQPEESEPLTRLRATPVLYWRRGATIGCSLTHPSAVGSGRPARQLHGVARPAEPALQRPGRLPLGSDLRRRPAPLPGARIG